MADQSLPPNPSPYASLSNAARTTLVTFLIIVVTLLFLTLRMVSEFLLPVFMGGILSMLTRPIYLRIRGKQKGGNRAALIVTIGLVLLILLPLALFITLGVRQGIAVGKNLSESGISFQAVTEKITNWPALQSLGLEPQAIETNLQEYAKTFGKVMLATVLGIASHLPSIAFQLVLMSLSCFFFLTDGPTFAKWAGEKIPMDPSVRKRLIKSFHDTSDSVIWATLAASGAQAGSMAAIFVILHVPASLLAAGATFFLAWIPMVGGSPVWILGALYLLLNGSIGKMIIVVLAGLSMGILDNIVRAAVLKGRSEMHPLVSLVAIFGGIEMFGMMGVFLGPIIAAVLISILDVWPSVGKRLGLLEG